MAQKSARDPHEHPGLEVEVERAGPCLAKVRFRVSAEEFGRTRAEGMRRVARRSRMKGFRPGKVPPAVLEKHFGADVERETVEHFLHHAFDRAVKKEELRPAANPRVNLEELMPEKGQPLAGEFELVLRPQVELKEYKGLAVERRPAAVTDEEVDQALADVRRQHARPEPAGEEGLAAEGMAMARLEFEAEGAGEPVLVREGIRLNPRSTIKGVAEGALEAALTGAKEGETREVAIVFPEEFPEEAARGKRGVCRVALGQVFRIVPPSDEELFEGFGVEDEAGLRDAVRTRIGAAKEEQEDARIENELLERLLASHPIELPEPLVAEQTEASAREARQSLEEQGLADEELETRLAQERERLRERVTRSLRAVYLMEEIAKAEGLGVREEDLVGELRGIAERNRVDFAEVRKYYQEEGLLQQLALELLERKVRSFLRESADIRSTG